MTQDTDSTNKVFELRHHMGRLAEKAGNASEISAPAGGEGQNLSHELQLSQTELKRQNEELLQAQIALRESWNHCTHLYDFAPAGYLTLSNEGLILESNLTAATMLGVDRQSLIGTPLSHFVSQEDSDAWHEHLRQVFETQSNQACQIQLVGKDGARLPAQVSSVARQDNSGQSSVCLTVLSVITRGHKAEEDLQKATSQWQATFDSVSVAVWLLDSEMRILRANKATESIFSLDRGQIVGQHCCKVLYGSSEPVEECLVVHAAKSLQREKAELLVGEGWFEITADPVLDNAGRHLGTVVFAGDITERKRVEEAFFQAKQDWEDTFNSIQDMITIHDKDFNIVHANRAAERILGLPSSAISDAIKCYSYYHGMNCPPEMCPSCRCVETGQQVVSEFFEPHLNMFLDLTAIPRFDTSAQLTGVIHIARDITERKRAEEEKAKLEQQLFQSQKMEAIGTLAGGVAHDFNNILTIISGYAELALTEKKEGDAGYDELGIVLGAARRGADLVRQILTFSRKVETRPKPVYLNHQVEHAQSLLHKILPKMIEIETHLADDLKIIMADPTQVEQVLLNLAVNARDAMPEGGKLGFRTENCLLDEDYCRLDPDIQPGEYVALTVSDTGQGMEREVLERVFEPFFSTKNPGEGTGLGLATVFGIVKNHHGHITCSSEPGDGTTFKIFFPVIRQEETKPGVSTTGEFAAMGSETILLVDDEELIGDLGKRILTQSGYRVLTAANGKEALQVYRREKADISLVILDIIMPVMSGNECLGELLKVDPNVKVLVSSGFAIDTATKETLERGAKGFVSKPFQTDRLLRAVRQVLDE